MRIRTRLAWLSALPLLVFLLLSGHALQVREEMAQTVAKARLADLLFRHANELAELCFETAYDTSERALVLWQRKWDQLDSELNLLAALSRQPDENRLVGELRAGLGRSLTLHHHYHGQGHGQPEQREQRDAMLMAVHSLMPRVEELHHRHHDAMSDLVQRQGEVGIVLTLMLAAGVALISALLVRSLSRSLTFLREGMREIGHGDLSRRIRLASRDELAEMAEQFNRMTERLDQTTVSRQTMAEERDRVQRILDTVQTLIVALDGEGRVTLINRAGCQLLGWREEELLGRNWFETCLVQPDGMLRVYPIFQAIMTGEIANAEYFENAVLTRSGGERLIAWRNSYLHDRHGAIVGTLSSGEDITERRHAEEVLRQSEERFRTVADFAYDWEYWIGPEREWLFISPSCERITGHSRQAFLDDPDLLEKIVHPEDRAALTRHLEEVGRQEAAVVDFRIVRPDGALRWIAHGCRPVYGEGGRFLGRRVSNHDITERKEAEAHLAEALAFNERIVAESPAGIVIFHHSGPTVMGNASAARILGASREQLLARNFHQIPVWRETGMYDTALLALASGQPHRYEAFVRSSFGAEVWLDTQFVPLTLAGEPHLLVLFTDVSHLHQLQEATARAKEAAEEMSRAKSEFLANMSHEIRTPMNAILGMAELLWETPLLPEQRQYVQVFRSAGESLLGIINDILDISKIEAGRLGLEEIDFHLEQEVATVCELIAPRARDKGLELSWRIAPEVPSALRGDPIRLRQVLLNLLGNAVKFTEAGEVALTVARDASAAPGADAVGLAVTVRDTGIGIPPDRLEGIFESFVQVDRSMTRRFGGTGLGLAIVRQLVERMGGRVTVASVPGEGSTFRFSACFRRGGEVTATILHRREVGTLMAEEGRLERPLRILLADDSEDNRLLVRAFLNGTAHALECAENGAVALEMMKSGRYDLVLMDVQMPVMDGYAATRAWRAWEREQGRAPIPVIALTAYALHEDVARSLAVGCDGHLAKPIKKKTLLGAICRHGGGLGSPVSRGSGHGGALVISS